jgi:hypothetical protein
MDEGYEAANCTNIRIDEFRMMNPALHSDWHCLCEAIILRAELVSLFFERGGRNVEAQLCFFLLINFIETPIIYSLKWVYKLRHIRSRVRVSLRCILHAIQRPRVNSRSIGASLQLFYSRHFGALTGGYKLILCS